MKHRAKRAIGIPIPASADVGENSFPNITNPSIANPITNSRLTTVATIMKIAVLAFLFIFPSLIHKQNRQCQKNDKNHDTTVTDVESRPSFQTKEAIEVYAYEIHHTFVKPEDSIH